MEPERPNPAGRGVLLSRLQISVFASGLIYLSGCASASYQKADVAAESLQKAAVEINIESRAIDTAMGTLDDLVNKPAADLRPQFERFDASLNWLIDSAKRAEQAADRASKNSQDYFQSWNKDLGRINYEAVRDQSVSRKTQVSEEFNSVEERYRQNQAVVEPLISYLRDIRISLSTDLTGGGLEAVKPLVENARENARKVQTALAQLSDDLAASSNRMSSTASQEAASKAAVSETTQTTQQRAESTGQSSAQ